MFQGWLSVWWNRDTLCEAKLPDELTNMAQYRLVQVYRSVLSHQDSLPHILFLPWVVTLFSNLRILNQFAPKTLSLKKESIHSLFFSSVNENPNHNIVRTFVSGGVDQRRRHDHKIQSPKVEGGRRSRAQGRMPEPKVSLAKGDHLLWCWIYFIWFDQRHMKLEMKLLSLLRIKWRRRSEPPRLVLVQSCRLHMQRAAMPMLFFFL